MSGKSGGSFATILLALPLTAIALMGVFGVPEFASVIASHDGENLLRNPFRGRSENDRQRPDWDDRGWDDRDDPRDADRRRDAYGEEYGDDGYSDNAPMFADRDSNRDRWEAEPRDDARSPNSRDDRRGTPWDAPTDRTLTRNATARDDSPYMHDREYHEGSTGRGPSAAHPVDPFTPRNDGSASHSASQLDWREASRKLAEMGIDRYHLERGATPDTFLFVCLVTPAGSQHITHRFESESADPLLAVNQVLSQVDTWLQQRYANNAGFPLNIRR
ncbi:MAG: hypothetical protein KDA58_08985 [Planctomycetaceae bacterium]|nr:hypothetical protein [Planctomycetaceae bacterium]